MALARYFEVRYLADVRGWAVIYLPKEEIECIFATRAEALAYLEEILA